jgi:hypothetical protein
MANKPTDRQLSGQTERSDNCLPDPLESRETILVWRRAAAGRRASGGATRAAATQRPPGRRAAHVASAALDAAGTRRATFTATRRFAV